MHIILIAIIGCLLLFIVLQSRSPNAGADQSGNTQTPPTGNNSKVDAIAFLSHGKLFCSLSGKNVQQINSPFAQKVLNEAERRNSMHGWKKGTSFDSSFTGKANGALAETIPMTFRAATFVDSSTIIYFLNDGDVGGLFEQNLVTGEEKRLLHQQRLDLDHFHYDAANNRILCSAGSDTGIRNIASFDRASNDITHHTEGDTVDALPCSYPGQSETSVVMQSAGIGRSPSGHMLAIGPASLNVLSTDSQQLEPIAENEQYDYMHPAVHPNGDLYCIRRPFEVPHVGVTNIAIDTILFPFRMARAFFSYLNFFSLMYTQKPLTSASGPKIERDRKDIIIKGKRIDTEKAERSAGVVRGIPSLVPSNWQLVARNRFGQETELANHVLSFDISDNGNIIYTNGFGVFEHTENGPVLLFKDSLIETILVH